MRRWFPKATRREMDYGLSTLGKSLPWASAEAFSLYFLTDVANVSALRAGTFVFLFFLWNAFCDPVVGWLLDHRARGALLSRRHYVAGTLLFSCLFVLSFTYIASAVSSLLLLASGLAFRTAYAVVDVPHNALLSRLGDTSKPRLGLSAARQIAGLTATFAVTFAARPLLQAGGPVPAAGYVLYAAGIATLGALLFLGFFPQVDAAPPPHHAAAAEPGDAAPRGALLAAILAIVLTAMTGSLVAGAFSKDVVYIAKYVFNDAGWTLDALTALMIGRFLAVPLWWLAPLRIGLPASVALSWLLIAGAGATLSWLPPDKRLFEGGLLIIGIGLGGINALAWAIIPQLTHRLSQQRAGATDTRVFGLFTAMTKIASGLSGLILGLLLLRTGIADAASAASAQAARFYAMACFIPVPSAGFGLLCLLAYSASAAALSRPPRRRRFRRSRPTPRR